MFNRKNSFNSQTTYKPLQPFTRTSSTQTEFKDDYIKKPFFLQLPANYNAEMLKTLRKQVLGVCVDAEGERQKKLREKKDPPCKRTQQIGLFDMICPQCLGENAVIDSDNDGDFVRCSCGYNERKNNGREIGF